MKTLVVLFSILFCMAISNVNAQSVSEKETVNDYYYLECNCDGVWDWLYGPITYHMITHFGKDGKEDWINWQFRSAEFVNLRTGEKCRLSNIQKQDAWGTPGSQMGWHGNLIGDMGTHYLFSVVFDISNGMELVKYEAKCL